MNADIFALLLKVSVILAVAALLALLLRSSSAARRHFVWSAAMTSVVVLVVLQTIVPPIVVPVAQQSALAAIAHASAGNSTSPGSNVSRITDRATTAVVGVSDAALNAALLPNVRSVEFLPSEATARTSAVSVASIPVRGVTRTVAETNVRAATHAAIGTLTASNERNSRSLARDILSASAETSMPPTLRAVAEPAPEFEFPRVQLRAFLLSAWAVGSLLLLMRIAFAHRHLQRIARSSQVIVNAAVSQELELTEARLGLHKQVKLLVHSGVNTPCTAGWRSPIILLPASYGEWSDARRQAVFTHELAHIARGDSIAQFVASIACALFWFHPAIWFAARLLRAEGERAADDCVINSGMAPVEYADHLLAIANSSSPLIRVPTMALGMARSSQLELRLRAMLNVQQSRTVFTRGAQRLLGGAAFLAVVPFAALQARVQEPRPKPVVPAVAVPTQQPPVTQPPTPRVPVAVPPTVVPAVPAAPGVAPSSAVHTLVAPQSVPIHLLPTPAVSPAIQPGRGLMLPPSSSEHVIATPMPGRGLMLPPSSSEHVIATPMPGRGLMSPPLQGEHVIATPTPGRGLMSPPLPGEHVIATPMPSRGLMSPPLPGEHVIATPMPGRGVMSTQLPSERAIATPTPRPGRGVPSPLLSGEHVIATPVPSRGIQSTASPSGGVVAPPVTVPPTTAPPVALPTRTKPPQDFAIPDTTFERTLEAVTGESLFVNIPAGGNVTVHGWASNTAKLRANLGGKYWRQTVITFRQRPNGIQLFATPDTDVVRTANGTRDGKSVNIILRSPLNSPRYVPTTVDNEFELWVPRKTHVKFTSPIGALTLRDIEGDIDGETKLGAIDIASTAGKASLVTENGDIRVVSSTLTGSVHTGCGAVNVSNSSNSLSATTALDPSPPKDPRDATKLIFFGGTVHTEYCRLKPRMRAGPHVDESIPYGPIALDSAPNGGTLLTKSGDITLGSTGGVLMTSTSNANIDIRRMGGDITATNRNGNIDIRAVNTSSNVHNVWVRATSGTVTIELPENIDAEFDVEASYGDEFNKKFNRAARITDDFTLVRTQTPWYVIDGEAQRAFVRTRGTLGKGTGRIYIRVTDGDVVLKRVKS